MTTKTIDQLTKGETVTAINGTPRPFPYVVAQVITHTIGKGKITMVKWEHGGLITPCDPTTAVATVAD